ncbi:MAG: histidinol-phosphate transaminase [Pseudomonadota bacterium]
MSNFTRRGVLTAAISGAATAALTGNAWSRTPPPQSLIRLSSNENPYGPSPAALKAARETAARGAYYSWDLRTAFRDAIADGEGVSRDNVVISTGSNEALCAATAAWGKEGRILAPSLTYSSHLMYARRAGLSVQTLPLRSDLAIDLAAMAAAVTDDTSLVYVCNPNNPTGLPLDGAELRDFCREVGKRATVLVDEAYNELAEDPASATVMDLVKADENVIVTRTFSKVYGMAGMRMGYAMGRSDLMEKLRSHVMSWPSSIALAAGIASYGDEEFVAFSRQQIDSGRKIVNDCLRQHGVEPLPSSTNFVYADIGRSAAEFGNQMRNSGVMIGRVFAGYPNHIRVSMGRLEDLRAFSRIFGEVYTA